ncbi:MAG TPA: AAA family ATPase, partial [Bacteroidia bacterium]
MYDVQGNETELAQYNNAGGLNYKIIHQYDANGNLLEEISMDGQGNITLKYTYVYDDKGHKIEQSYYQNYRNMQTADGKPVIETTENAHIFRSKSTWKYDDKDNEIEQKNYDGLGNLTGSLVNEYLYNEMGIKLEYTTYYYDIDGKLHMQITYKCNEHGHIVRREPHYNCGNYQPEFIFYPQYDKDGKLLNPDYERGGPPPVKEKLESETEDFVYDAHKNWIKKTTYYSGKGNKFYNRAAVNIFLREITYYGEENAHETPVEQFFAPVKSSEPEEEEENKTNKSNMPKLSPTQKMWLAEGGTVDAFSPYRYYVLTNKEMPSLVINSGPYIEAIVLLRELKENLDAQVIHSYSTEWDGTETLQRYTLSFPKHPGYLLHASGMSAQNADEFEIPEFISDYEDENGWNELEENGVIYFSALQLLRPSDGSGKRELLDEYGDESGFESDLNYYINKCTLRKIPDQPTIYMIEADANGFTMVDHVVDNDFEIKDLDVNYGYGFTKFHNELMQRFHSGTKGLVLFHGLPGTGKTYYIRHLLRQMASANKAVIYVPPNLVDHLVEPGFMTFLSNEVKTFSDDGKFCVLLIEDAEPLLAKRQEGVRIQGVTNLLNMTDGLLNDMLNLQIICTFNVDLHKLDSALLRPGRLIARKEFKALSELDANLLAQRLGIKHHFKKLATLSEVYSFLKDKSTLVHDVEPDRDASTNIDDL